MIQWYKFGVEMGTNLRIYERDFGTFGRESRAKERNVPGLEIRLGLVCWKLERTWSPSSFILLSRLPTWEIQETLM